MESFPATFFVTVWGTHARAAVAYHITHSLSPSLSLSLYFELDMKSKMLDEIVNENENLTGMNISFVEWQQQIQVWFSYLEGRNLWS